MREPRKLSELSRILNSLQLLRRGKRGVSPSLSWFLFHLFLTPLFLSKALSLSSCFSFPPPLLCFLTLCLPHLILLFLCCLTPLLSPRHYLSHLLHFIPPSIPYLPLSSLPSTISCLFSSSSLYSLIRSLPYPLSHSFSPSFTSILPEAFLSSVLAFHLHSLTPSLSWESRELIRASRRCENFDS